MTEVRIAAHVHSCWSYDGKWSLDELARAFRRQRYDAVLMAEHDRGFDQRRWNDYQAACSDASTHGLLLIPGIEYEDADNVVHTAVWGSDIPFLGAARPTLDVLRAAREQGAVTVFAHPWRRNAVARYAREWAPLLTAVEIWNRKYDGVAPRPDAIALADQEALAPFVSLDFHTARQFFPLAISVAAEGAPSRHTLIEAIRQRSYRPEFLGMSALRFSRGAEGAAVRYAEEVRLRLRKSVRRLTERRAG